MRGFVMAAVAVAACAANAEAAGRAEWMRGSFGLSVHWTAQCALEDGTQVPFEEAVDRFDVERFADALESVGARHCIFTIAHGLQKMPCPNAALDAIDPGRTTKRDLVGELIAALGRRGIRFIAYYNHSCNGNDDVEWRRQGSPCRRVSPTPISPRTSGSTVRRAGCSPSTSSSPPTGPSTPPRSRNFGDAPDDN